MIRTIMRSAVLLGLGLTLTACAQHNPAAANCFNFRDAPAQSATATTTTDRLVACKRPTAPAPRADRYRP